MASRRRRLSESEYAALVEREGAAMRDFMDAKARRLGIEPEDALQDALVDVWVECREKGWPEDPVESRRFLFRQLRDAAIDAVRARRGRDNTRPDVVPVDFGDLGGSGGDEPRDALAASIGAHLASQALERDDDPGFLTRGLLVGAFAALTERQKQIVFRRDVHKDTPAELAEHLGVSETLIRQDHFHGLRTLRDLIAHAAVEVESFPAEERERLYAFLDGTMPKGERTALPPPLRLLSHLPARGRARARRPVVGRARPATPAAGRRRLHAQGCRRGSRRLHLLLDHGGRREDRRRIGQARERRRGPGREGRRRHDPRRHGHGHDGRRGRGLPVGAGAHGPGRRQGSHAPPCPSDGPAHAPPGPFPPGRAKRDPAERATRFTAHRALRAPPSRSSD